MVSGKSERSSGCRGKVTHGKGEASPGMAQVREAGDPAQQIISRDGTAVGSRQLVMDGACVRCGSTQEPGADREGSGEAGLHSEHRELCLPHRGI